MKKTSVIWSVVGPVADVVGILGFFGFSIKNINWVNIPWYLYFVFLFFLFVFIRLLFRNVYAITEAYKDTNVSRDLEKISFQDNIREIKQALPRTDTLLRLYEKTKTRIKNWSEDAVLKSVNLYISYSDGHWKKPSMQVIAFSAWKNEEGWFYAGRLTNEDFQEGESVHVGVSVVEDKLFFVANPSWQLLVIKAFGVVSGKLVKDCRVCVSEDAVRIEYLEGRVKKEVCFKMTVGFKKIVRG